MKITGSCFTSFSMMDWIKQSIMLIIFIQPARRCASITGRYLSDMQVFVPYPSPIDVAKCLDPRRLRKQVIECDQILKAIWSYSDVWKCHPVVKMYADHSGWLWYYRETLDSYDHGYMALADHFSYQCDTYLRPPFLTNEFCDQHKRRLFTKAPELYPQFWPYGESDENWYFVDGKLLKYINGKRI